MDGDLGYIIRIHGQEFNSFRRKTRSKALDRSSPAEKTKIGRDLLK
jgi:hypothetical protein